jgi:hypothetical protein
MKSLMQVTDLCLTLKAPSALAERNWWALNTRLYALLVEPQLAVLNAMTTSSSHVENVFSSATLYLGKRQAKFKA